MKRSLSFSFNNQEVKIEYQFKYNDDIIEVIFEEELQIIGIGKSFVFTREKGCAEYNYNLSDNKSNIECSNQKELFVTALYKQINKHEKDLVNQYCA